MGFNTYGYISLHIDRIAQQRERKFYTVDTTSKESRNKQRFEKSAHWITNKNRLCVSVWNWCYSLVFLFHSLALIDRVTVAVVVVAVVVHSLVQFTFICFNSVVSLFFSCGCLSLPYLAIDATETIYGINSACAATRTRSQHLLVGNVYKHSNRWVCLFSAIFGTNQIRCFQKENRQMIESSFDRVWTILSIIYFWKTIYMFYKCALNENR